jgi:hypothetical protein
MADPYCLAMVLCDAAHRDPATLKHSILGTFSSVNALDFPAQIQLCVYFAITDGLGPTTLRLQLIDAECGFLDATNEDPDPHRVFSVKFEVDFKSPLMVVEGAIGITTALPNPGLYHCELWANNVSLMSRRLTALRIPNKEESEQ